MGFLDFNNKYGRPIPYVWFLIIAVSSIPLFLFSTIDDSIPCENDYILNGNTPDEYFEKKKFLIDYAIDECNKVKDIMSIISKGFSIIMFGFLVYSMKPYPFSSLKSETSQETRKSAI